MKVRLTAAFCATAQCAPGKKKIDYWDCGEGSVTGLVLEVRSSGGRTMYLRWVDPITGRQHMHKIGRLQDIGFAKAKEIAKRLRSEVVLGGNPATQKKDRKAVPTYSWLAQKHLEYAETYQRSYCSTEAIMRCHIRPRWEMFRLDEISDTDIAKWFAEKADEGLKPATVEKIRAVFGRSFKLALQWKVPGVVSNPVSNVPRRRFDNAREVFLTAAQARRLREEVEKSSNTQLKYIVSLLLLTGARKSELLHAKWEHVDLERRVWLIPTSKNGQARRVPLSLPALKVIKELPRFPECEWLLPNPDTLKPFVSIKRAWMTARDKAGLPALRIHDCRHSFASFAINAGVDLYSVGKLLGHKDFKSTARYSHVENSTLQAAVDAGAARQLGDAAIIEI
jgi:integrase